MSETANGIVVNPHGPSTILCVLGLQQSSKVVTIIMLTLQMKKLQREATFFF